MATKLAKATLPFEGVRCIHCGEIDSLSVNVATLALTCGECSEETTRAEVDAVMDQFRRLFGWIESAAQFAAPK